MRNTLTRQEKLDALLNLSQGTGRIDDLVPTRYQVWNKKGDLYHGPQGRVLNEGQFNNLNEVGVKYILVLRRKVENILSEATA